MVAKKYFAKTAFAATLTLLGLLSGCSQHAKMPASERVDTFVQEKLEQYVKKGIKHKQSTLGLA
ncbi:MAG: hypothetical protein Q8O89_00850, partial [Nanoarchaeota archaeon]|nr:hypothetical protein [Nanoarchaeota archaeon]